MAVSSRSTPLCVRRVSAIKATSGLAASPPGVSAMRLCVGHLTEALRLRTGGPRTTGPFWPGELELFRVVGHLPAHAAARRSTTT